MSLLPVGTPLPAIRTLEAQIADLRDQVFAVAEAARRSVPYDCTSLHVSLQSASNDLGEAERALCEGGLLPEPVL